MGVIAVDCMHKLPDFINYPGSGISGEYRCLAAQSSLTILGMWAVCTCFRWDLKNTEYEKLSVTILHDTSYQVLQGEVL
jgi:hypothetical protein